MNILSNILYYGECPSQCATRKNPALQEVKLDAHNGPFWPYNHIPESHTDTSAAPLPH